MLRVGGLGFFREGILSVLFKRACVCVLLLALLSAAMFPLARRAMSGMGAVSEKTVRALSGTSGLFALLGGYRSVVADFVWIKAYVEWERRLYSECVSSIELASCIDPSMTIFWTQGASIIAFDTPHWIMGELGRKPSKSEEESIRRKQANAAIKYLDEGIKIYPDNPDLWLSKGQIYIIALSDYKNAQHCYAKIAEIYGKECPVYILRIYAAILGKNGYFKQARAVLQEIFDGLEPDSPIKDEISKNIKACDALIEKASGGVK